MSYIRQVFFLSQTNTTEPFAIMCVWQHKKASPKKFQTESRKKNCNTLFFIYLQDTFLRGMKDTTHNYCVITSLKVWIIISLLAPLHLSLSAQEYGRFDHFSTADGLISDKVYSMACDTNGFIWMATDFGFDRFDGKEFKHYNRIEYPSLRREDVLITHIGDNNNIYIGGYYGLMAEYDQKRDSLFDKMPAIYDTLQRYEETEGFYEASDGRRFALTTSGVFLYDPTTQTFGSDNEIYQSTKEIYAKSMYIDKYGRYWIGSIDKYYILDKNARLIKACNPPSEGCGFISNIIPINDHQLLITNQTREMWIFDIKEDVIEEPTLFKAPFGNTIKVLKDKGGRYWFATDGYGLWYTDEAISPDVKFHNMRPYNSSGAEIRKIYSMTTDPKGNLWIGTRNSGIWCYRGNELTGLSFSKNYGFPKIACTGVAEDQNGNIVIGSDGTGVYFVSPDFRNIHLVELENNNVCSVSSLENGDILVPTWGGGTLIINGSNFKVHSENYQGISQACRSYFGANRYGKNIYVGSAGDGLYQKLGDSPWQKITLSNDTIEQNKWVFKAVEDPFGNLWVLTTTHLWKISEGKCENIKMEIYCDDKHTSVTLSDGICDQYGNFIATTDAGVIQVRAGSKYCELLDFTPICSYHSIQMDNNGIFWTSGNNGITRIDMGNKTCQILTDSRNNISSMRYFVFRSSFKDSKGKIHFGTNDGFVSLDPAHLTIDTTMSFMAFSDLYIGNHKVKRGSGPLEKHNLGEGELVLAYNQTDITLLYDAIDYTEFDPIQYRYRLNGLKEEWTEISGKKSIHFSHIPTGNYTLIIEAFRNNKDCQPKQIELKIKVLPPWWESLWFKVLLGIAALLLIGGLILLRVRRLMASKRELEQKVNERTSELKEALNDKDRLISVVAHDLKNPMFAIVGALENLTSRETSLSEEERRRITSGTYDSAKALQNEMLKILDWAQSKKEDISCHPTDVDIQHTVINVTLLLANLLEKKGIQLIRENNVTHFAYADPRMLEAVIRNLIGNAIKFTPSGGTISILSWMDNKNVKIAVKDTGVGMNEAQVEALKNGGETVSQKGTDNESGTGLGYKICKNYILRNNGSMDLESKLGEGTTITITLPASTRKIEIKEEYKIDDRKKETDYSILTGNTALIVDDNPLICDNLKTLLASYLNVIVANNGKEALSLAEQHMPDIILSDVEMPIMNGIEMSRVIDQTDSIAHIPLLFLSARNEDSDRLLGLKSGAVDYIPKPFSPEELLIKVCNILLNRQKTQNHLLTQMMKQSSEEEGETQSESSEKREEKVNPFVKQFLAVIEKRYMESDISVEDIAKEMCLSKSTLTRRTNSIIGKTPLELLNEFRLNEALRRLKEADSETQISDIAYTVGFSDPAYFSRRFREYFGYKPSQVINKS